jgi:hypothetical protein
MTAVTAVTVVTPVTAVTAVTAHGEVAPRPQGHIRPPA